MEPRDPASPAVTPLLQPGEIVHHEAEALEGVVAVTDRRVLIKSDERVTMDLPFEAVRRIQFDVERKRPAALIIVPEAPRHEPQVLSVPPERLHEVAAA